MPVVSGRSLVLCCRSMSIIRTYVGRFCDITLADKHSSVFDHGQRQSRTRHVLANFLSRSDEVRLVRRAAAAEYSTVLSCGSWPENIWSISITQSVVKPDAPPRRTIDILRQLQAMETLRLCLCQCQQHHAQNSEGCSAESAGSVCRCVVSVGARYCVRHCAVTCR